MARTRLGTYGGPARNYGAFTGKEEARSPAPGTNRIIVSPSTNRLRVTSSRNRLQVSASENRLRQPREVRR